MKRVARRPKVKRSRRESDGKVVVVPQWLPRPVAHYDATEWSINRATVKGSIQSARQDATTLTRLEILRKSRSLVQNNPLAQKIVDVFVRYTVGDGINPIPMSEDENWNRAALRWFLGWNRYAHLESRMTFFDLQRIIASSAFVDGDILSNHVLSPSTGRPRLQLIEGHRIGHSKNWGQDDVWDGVQIDGNGRPIYFFRYDRFENFLTYLPAGEPVPMEADHVVLHHFPTRVGQVRGLSKFTPVLTLLQDLRDTLEIEMQALKNNASIDHIIQRKGGEILVDELEERIGNINPTPVTGDTVHTPPVDPKYFYRTMFGPEVKILDEDDEYKPWESKRPTPEFTAFLKSQGEMICHGIGMSPFSVFGHSDEGGVAHRTLLEQDDRFFRTHSAQLSRQFQRTWDFVINWAQEMGEIADEDGNALTRPRDWQNVDWHPPRRITADHRHDAKSAIELCRAGLLNAKKYYGDRNEDWRREFRQNAEETLFAQKLSDEIFARDGIRIDPKDIRDLGRQPQQPQQPQQAGGITNE